MEYKKDVLSRLENIAAQVKQEISKNELKKRENAIQGLINPIEKELNKIQIQNSRVVESLTGECDQIGRSDI